MINKNKTHCMAFILVLVFFTASFLDQAGASSTVIPLKGQSIYVPIYSHIYHGNNERPFDLAATLSIRNTDPKQEITIFSVDYFDSNGNLLKKYLENPIKLKRLASIRYVIKSSDKSGGSGANFIVRWKSEKLVNPPLVEAIMISTASQQGISFISRGLIIKE